MKLRIFSPLSLGVASMLIATCGYAGAQDAPPTLHLVGANAQLVQKLDARSATQGQTVKAKLTTNVKNAGMSELPKGTMLIGKVDQVEMSNGSGTSSLSIVFDQARLADGKTVPIKATLLGAYPSSQGTYYEDTGTGGALMAEMPEHISPDAKVDQEPGSLGHIALHSSVQSNASGVFTSTDHDISLKRGTWLQLGISEEGSNS